MARFTFRTLRLRLPSGAPALVADAGGFRVVESRRRGGVTHVALFGDVDLLARRRLREVLLASAMTPTTEVCVDLGGARFLDCLGIMARWRGRRAGSNAGPVIFHPGTQDLPQMPRPRPGRDHDE